jgi:hypothetical protein
MLVIADHEQWSQTSHTWPVMLSEAKHLWFISVRSLAQSRSEILRFAQNDSIVDR